MDRPPVPIRSSFSIVAHLKTTLPLNTPAEPNVRIRRSLPKTSQRAHDDRTVLQERRQLLKLELQRQVSSSEGRALQHRARSTSLLIREHGAPTVREATLSFRDLSSRKRSGAESFDLRPIPREVRARIDRIGHLV